MKLIKTLRAMSFTLYTDTTKGAGLALAATQDTFLVTFGKFDTLDFNCKITYIMVNLVDYIAHLVYINKTNPFKFKT